MSYLRITAFTAAALAALVTSVQAQDSTKKGNSASQAGQYEMNAPFTREALEKYIP
jgi:hypothetical protein